MVRGTSRDNVGYPALSAFHASKVQALQTKNARTELSAGKPLIWEHYTQDEMCCNPLLHSMMWIIKIEYPKSWVGFFVQEMLPEFGIKIATGFARDATSEE